MEMHKKLKFTEKLSYGIADLPEAANSIIAAFLTMFYTDNIGLAAAAVGTMFFISKLFDGISDILAGILIDKTRTKWGKARPWLLWLSVPTGLSIALIFFIPQDGSKTMQMIYAFVTYNLFTSIMFTITGIARSSLLALMTQDFRERGSMASFGMFFGLAGTILGCSLTFPLIFKLGGDIRAWRILFGIYGVIVTAGLLAGFFMSKEYVTSVEATSGKEVQKISFKEGIKLFFTNKYLILALVATVLVNFVTQINSCSQTYFYKYTMGNEMLTTTLNLVSIIPILVGIVLFVGDLVKLAGGTNIYGDGDGKDFVNVSVEDMLKQNPDLILRTSHAMPEQVKEYFQQEFSNNETWQQFAAVKNNKVFDLNNEYFGMSANFNYQKGLEDLEGILYENN